MFFDTHAHIQDDKFKDDQTEVINKALNQNVDLLMVVGYDRESNKKAIELAEQYEFIYAAVGYHPSAVNEIEETDYNILSKQLKHPKVKAVGEIGLDYYWVKDNKEKQKEVFIKQLSIAKDNNLPVIVHNREATADIYDILKANYAHGIMHSFSSSLEMAKEFIKLGILIGISGTVTFKNAPKVQNVAQHIPLSKIVVETDCPYLTPDPYRGKRNEPSYVPLVAKKIAELQNKDINVVAEITTTNAKKLFNIE